MKYSITKKLLVLLLLSVSILSTSCSQQKLRIVSLTPNWTNTVASLDAVDELVGVTRYCIFPSTIPKLVEEGKLEVVGGFVDMDVEKIAALNPDLVLSSSGLQLKVKKELEERGIKVIHMDLSSLNEVYSKITELGEAINRNDEAEELVNGIKTELVEIAEKYKDMPRVSVYYEINYSYKCVPGKDSYITELIKLVGGDPIFSDRPGVAPSVTWEEVVEKNPDVILMPLWANAGGPYFNSEKAGYGTTTPNEIATRDGAEKVEAVKNGKVKYIDSAKTKQAGPKIPTAADLFGKAIHADGDMELIKLDKVPENMETLISGILPSIYPFNPEYQIGLQSLASN